MTHPTDELAGYAAGTLPAARADAVRRHLTGCVTCTGELAGWQSIATAVRVPVPPPGAHLLHAVQSRASAPRLHRTAGSRAGGAAGSRDAGAAAARGSGLPAYGGAIGGRPGRRALAVLGYQYRIIRWPVWLAAAVVLTAGTVIAALARDEVADRILATVVSLGAAVAIATVCGRGADPAGELVGPLPTSPRVTLLARLTVVLTGVVVAGLVASTVVDAGAVHLVTAWLAPLVPLTALSFALAVFVRPAAGVTVATALWFVRALSTVDWVRPVLDLLWAPNVVVLVVAVALIAGTILLAPVNLGAGRRYPVT